MIRQDILKNIKRVVIKIGSSVISNKDKGRSSLECGLSKDWVRHYARQIKLIQDKGYDVVLVSSGAIMAGRERLGLSRADLSIPEKQACAAIGQSFLMHTYEKAFEKKDIKVAQILLSHDDLGNRRRYLNAKHTIEALLERNVIPIINENDSVTVEEIKIGDNDTLSATVACLVDAQLLIILSDVEGLFNRDPSIKIKGEKAELLSHVARVNDEIERTAGKSNNKLTVGGMYTKVIAAKKTMSFGIPTLVVNGLDEKVLENIFSGKDVGTLFWSGKGKIRDRKHWIAHTLKPAGTLVVDAGARKALIKRGKSLLPAGLIKVKGDFEFGKAVMIVDEEGKEIGRGLVNYNSSDLLRIKGMKTPAIKKMIGKSFYEEVIHRDDLVIFFFKPRILLFAEKVLRVTNGGTP
ncbi:glutamate 5-kinase [Nitrospinaceae bacterium]|nr:glutamate 5-kinase [Nitrospinaceae bacterium]